MSALGDKLFHLTTTNVFGSLGILILTQFILHWKIEDSVTCVLLFVVGTLFLAALSSLRGVAHGLSGLGEGLGAMTGAFAAGVTIAWANAKGVPTRDVKDALKEAALRAAVEGINQAPEVEPVVNLMKLNMTLDAMVLRSYENRPISRDAMVSADITTQPYWNLANHILKLLGLRKEKTTKWFGSGSTEEDIRFIKKNLKVVDDVVLVREGGRLGWKRVDLEEANFSIP